jgi:beta-mannanase
MGIAATLALAAVIVGVLTSMSTGTGIQSESDLPASEPQSVEHTRTETLTKDELLASPNKIAGMFSPNMPYNTAEYDEYVAAAGTQPNALNVFTKWDSPFRADAAATSYSRGAIPVVSWESWADGSATDDANYTLASIAAGAHDEYVRTFAKDVAAFGKPVIIRFNHEMNGGWYPWGNEVNGNTPEQYQQAWRHVHDIFAEEAASNVAWVWSVNIVRGVPNSRSPLVGFYPGDEYVDYVGMTGYAFTEADAHALFQPTTDIIREFTQKPLFLSEIGARDYAGKTAFISSFFTYIASRPDIAGFIWFQTTRSSGATGDYIFNNAPENTAAYATGVAALPLTTITHEVVERVPDGQLPTVTPYTLAPLY